MFTLQLNRVFSVLLITGGLAILSTTGYAWNEDSTHTSLNVEAAEVVQRPHIDTGGFYSEIGAFVERLKDGARDEDELKGALSLWKQCDQCRCTKHFYQPSSGLGFYWIGDRCNSAVNWARESDNDLTWAGAIKHYGYGDKSQAYKRLGHVAHLVGDMAQPDHVHLENHTKHVNDYIEGWVSKNWDLVGPKFWPHGGDSLKPTRFQTMDQHMTHLAGITYKLSSIQGKLKEKGTNSASGDIAKMFNVTYIGTWLLGNWLEMNGVPLGNWQGGKNGKTSCELGDIQKDATDDWWECSSETVSADIFNSNLCNLYYIEPMIWAKPRVYRDLNGNWVENRQKKWHLSRIYASQLLPLAVEHIAGLYMHFMDVVRHPPILRELNASQGSVSKYDQQWSGSHLAVFTEPPFIRRIRTLEDNCPTPVNGRWINGVDGGVSLAMSFGAEDDGSIKRMTDVQVDIGGINLTFVSSSDDSLWIGEFLPPSDGSLDGLQPVTVRGKDRAPHFPNRLFNGPAGDDLDTDPQTLALVRGNGALTGDGPSYSWEGYEPGIDMNHALKIDVTQPLITLLGGGIDDQGRSIISLIAQDVTSGLDTLGSGDLHNAILVSAPYQFGTVDETVITVAIIDDSRSARIDIRDVAGNPSTVLIPVMRIRNGPDLPPINPGSKGLTPVVIQGDEEFDPSTIDLSTLVFGPGQASPKPPIRHVRGNHSGYRDLMVNFSTADADIDYVIENACLSGRTLDSGYVMTCQATRLVGGGSSDSTGVSAWRSIVFKSIRNGNIHISWEPYIGDDFSHYNVYRREIEQIRPVRNILIGETTRPEWLDAEIDAVEKTYSITVVDTHSGESDVVAVGSIAVLGAPGVPVHFSLHNNHPNPFNPSTEISFSLPVAASVKLEVFDLLGRRVATLAEGNHGAGVHKVTWDGSDLASGVYFYRLRADDFISSKKMLLLK